MGPGRKYISMPAVNLSVPQKLYHFIYVFSKAFLINLCSLLTVKATPGKFCKRCPHGLAPCREAGPAVAPSWRNPKLPRVTPATLTRSSRYYSRCKCLSLCGAN